MGVYLDKCIETLDGIDPEELSSARLANGLGSGSGFAFYPVDRAMKVSGEMRHVGLKLPNHGRHLASRVTREIGFIDYCIEREPRLESYFPSFIGAVVIGEGVPAAVITEDASSGGRSAVIDAPASEEVGAMLYGVFCKLGSFREVMDDDALARSVAFRVDGVERLLDLAPAPLLPLAQRRCKELEESVGRTIRGSFQGLLELEIRDGSPLALDIMRLQPN